MLGGFSEGQIHPLNHRIRAFVHNLCEFDQRYLYCYYRNFPLWQKCLRL